MLVNNHALLHRGISQSSHYYYAGLEKILEYDLY